ncbi:MAG: hypothetical protein U0894_17655 [Pirellulales bacterium]
MMLATWVVGFVMLSPEEAKATKDDRYQHVLTARLSGSVGESLKQIEVAYSKNFLVLFNEPIKGEANWRQHLKMGICALLCQNQASRAGLSILGGMICRAIAGRTGRR